MTGEVITHEGRSFSPDGRVERPDVCACGHPPDPASGISAGFTMLVDDAGNPASICNTCAREAERHAFERDDVRAWIGYLDEKTAAVSTWHGTPLVKVTSRRSEKRWSPGAYTSHERVYWRGVDHRGRRWYGMCAGVGTITRMRRAK